MKHFAIIVQNIIQWYSIKPLVIFLSKKSDISLDILIYSPPQNNPEFDKISSNVHRSIISNGFTIKKPTKNSFYDLCLSPYSNMINFKCKYRIGYCYGSGIIKPYFTLQPDMKMNFHGMLLHDTLSATVLDAYSKTFLVPRLSLNPNIKHRKISSKPVILYLPTYNDPNVINVAQALEKLKNKFYIITKTHHGTDGLKDEKTKNKFLSQISDEKYDSNQNINSLFQKADIVLTGNSGASMDALYSKIPVAIASSNIKQRFANVPSTLEHLTQKGIILYSDRPTQENINSIISKTLTAKQKSIQSTASDKIFPAKTGSVKDWYQALENYLNGSLDDYCALHDFLTDQRKQLVQESIALKNLTLEIEQYKAKAEELNIYKQSRAHQTLEKILYPRRNHQNHKTSQ